MAKVTVDTLFAEEKLAKARRDGRTFALASTEPAAKHLAEHVRQHAPRLTGYMASTIRHGRYRGRWWVVVPAIRFKGRRGIRMFYPILLYHTLKRIAQQADAKTLAIYRFEFLKRWRKRDG